MKVSNEPLERKNGITSIEKCILLCRKKKGEWYKRYREITYKKYMTVFDTVIAQSSVHIK